MSDADARSRVIPCLPVDRREQRAVRAGALLAANRPWLFLLLVFPPPLSAQDSRPTDRAEALALADSVAKGAAAGDPSVIKDAIDVLAPAYGQPQGGGGYGQTGGYGQQGGYGQPAGGYGQPGGYGNPPQGGGYPR